MNKSIPIKEKIYKNGTPFPPRVWKQWFAHKSNRDIALEQEEKGGE